MNCWNVYKHHLCNPTVTIIFAYETLELTHGVRFVHPRRHYCYIMYLPRQSYPSVILYSMGQIDLLMLIEVGGKLCTEIDFGALLKQADERYSNTEFRRYEEVHV
jgi:hypothetical protein